MECLDLDTVTSEAATPRSDFEILSAPLERLLTTGGDRRLRIDPIRMLNGFGCRPWPRPEAFTFASSTATSISSRGFRAAATVRQRLIQSICETDLETACDHQAERLSGQIKTTLGLGGYAAEIVFSPSGTDSQIHALYVSQATLGNSLVSVLVASDETGSGTANATMGRHFSSATSLGASVLKGARLTGFAEDITTVAIPLREASGVLRPNAAIDQHVINATAQAVAAGKRVVLHVMDSSKFGWRCPSLDCLQQIQARWGGSVQIVVDACQLRLGRQRLAYYLQQNFLVLITGSKFFTGPPFSGALLVPANLSRIMQRVDAVPAGLKLYANRSDWPVCWQGVRSQLPLQPNVGQLLRWAAAVEELRDYFAIPVSYRSLAIQTFSSTVERLIAERPNLQLLPAYEKAATDDLDDEEMTARTIFPFFVRRHGKLLSFEACGQLYRALNCDVSHLLPRSATARQHQVAAQICHIGQPVGVIDRLGSLAGTLRISAGSRVVSETWHAANQVASLEKLEEEFAQIQTILDKIDLLVEYNRSLAVTARKARSTGPQ
jgi:hypothetical protein